MRYWHPFAEDAIEMIKAEGIQKLVILPLYPQFSLSTSGSALRVLERALDHKKRRVRTAASRCANRWHLLAARTR